jgi:hypothetical protein
MAKTLSLDEFLKLVLQLNAENLAKNVESFLLVFIDSS